MAAAMTQRAPGGFRKLPGFRFDTPPRRAATPPQHHEANDPITAPAQASSPRLVNVDEPKAQDPQQSSGKGWVFARFTDSVIAAVGNAVPARASTGGDDNSSCNNAHVETGEEPNVDRTITPSSAIENSGGSAENVNTSADDRSKVMVDLQASCTNEDIGIRSSGSSCETINTSTCDTAQAQHIQDLGVSGASGESEEHLKQDQGLATTYEDQSDKPEESNEEKQDIVCATGEPEELLEKDQAFVTSHEDHSGKPTESNEKRQDADGATVDLENAQDFDTSYEECSGKPLESNEKKQERAASIPRKGKFGRIPGFNFEDEEPMIESRRTREQAVTGCAEDSVPVEPGEVSVHAEDVTESGDTFIDRADNCGSDTTSEVNGAQLSKGSVEHANGESNVLCHMENNPLLNSEDRTDPEGVLNGDDVGIHPHQAIEDESVGVTSHSEGRWSQDSKTAESSGKNDQLEYGNAFASRFAVSAQVAVEKVAASLVNALPVRYDVIEPEQKTVMTLPGGGRPFRHVPSFMPPRERDEVSMAVVTMVVERVLADEIAAHLVVEQVVLRVLNTEQECEKAASLVEDYQEDYFASAEDEKVERPQPPGEVITHDMLKQSLPTETKAHLPDLSPVEQPLVCADCGAFFALKETLDHHICCEPAHEEIPDWLRKDLEAAYDELIDDQLPKNTNSMFRSYRWCTHMDVAQASWIGGTELLQYGEIMPRGAARALARLRQGTQERPTLALELGMGRGRLAMQFFLGGASVIGVELGSDRYNRGKTAMQRLVSCRPDAFEIVQSTSSNTQIRRCRTSVCTSPMFDARHGNFFTAIDKDEVEAATVVVLHVRLPEFCWSSVRSFLSNTTAGCRVLTSEDLRQVWGKRTLPFKFLGPCRASASWARADGHMFWLWEREAD